ncbi:MAG: hypothetical protein WHU10_06725, partial [Fimbriimonadales bacterium]
MAWSLGVILGIVASFGIVRSCTVDQKKLRAARKAGYERVSDYDSYLSVLHEVSEKRLLSGDEVNEVERLLQVNPKDKVGIGGLLGYQAKGPHRQRCIELTRHYLLNDDRPIVQTIGLLNLKRLDAPDWRQECEARLNSPDEDLRNFAKELLDGTIR